MSLPALSFTEVQTFAALRAFLLSFLPATVEVVRGQPNRVAEPQGSNFVVVSPTLRERLETNVAVFSDCSFTGSIAGNVLTVTAIAFGSIAVGNTLFGVGVTAGIYISSFGTGTGGIGTYNLSAAQTISSEKLSTGVQTILQPTQVTMQLDFHGPLSPDYLQMFTTLFRDNYAWEQFLTSGVDVAPLYAGEPHQAPWLNGEQQIEYRWSVDAVLQCNPTVTIAQQFADQAQVTLADVLVIYPH